MKVKILSDSYAADLERHINEYIKEGYIPKWETYKISKNVIHYIILVKIEKK